MTVQLSLEAATKTLDAAGIASAKLDAQVLLAYVLGVERIWLRTHAQSPLADGQQQAFNTLIQQRQQHVPVAYLTGTKEFYGHNFTVTPDVLVPRPETEHLLEAALACGLDEDGLSALDLCTGSGCLAVSLRIERPRWSIFASDISSSALTCAQNNARSHCASIGFYAGDLYAAVAAMPVQRFDIILSNPPYLREEQIDSEPSIKAEPRLALSGGDDGLTILRPIIAGAMQHLNRNGTLLLEIDPSQTTAVLELCQSAGFVTVDIIKDLAGDDRVVVARRG